MSNLILTTFDWVPELPRGYVRDLRVRWAMEEAGLRYRAERFEGLTTFPACRDYVTRATSRPAFQKAHADQMAHFATADAGA